MPRPLNKTQLLDVCQAEYNKLEKLLEGLTPEQMDGPSAPEAWSIKDIIAHLYEWQQMVFRWYETSLKGELTSVPGEGFNWGQIPALNQEIYEKYLPLPLDETLTLFRESHQKIVVFIEEISDEDLTTPGLYPWMNKNTMLAYLNSATGSHYRWACKNIRKVLKAQKQGT